MLGWALSPTGHYDFWPNGGIIQDGCPEASPLECLKGFS
jgi:hypothetical protein